MGPFSGEEFREDVLRPALKAHQQVEVDLDGALGLPSSFLDEAFGAFQEEHAKGRLIIHLTDNKIARRILDECLGHAPA